MKIDRIDQWRGEMAEWLKARASKACIPLRVSGVRIPLSPPLFWFLPSAGPEHNSPPKSSSFFPRSVSHAHSKRADSDQENWRQGQGRDPWDYDVLGVSLLRLPAGQYPH